MSKYIWIYEYITINYIARDRIEKSYGVSHLFTCALAEKKFTIVTPVYICNRDLKGAEFGLCAARLKVLLGISQNKVINTP
jgi:hypothetical protein